MFKLLLNRVSPLGWLACTILLSVRSQLHTVIYPLLLLCSRAELN